MIGNRFLRETTSPIRGLRVAAQEANARSLCVGFHNCLLRSVRRKSHGEHPRPRTVLARILIFIIEAFGPILRLLGFIVQAIYGAFFSWWLNPALDRRAEKSIKQAAPFLFDQYEGKVVSEPRTETRGSSDHSVCIASGNLFLRFSQWRTENYNVRVSPTFAPNDSYDLVDALRVGDPARATEVPPDINNWHHFARLLEPRFEQMQRSFNQENFADSKRKFVLLRVGELPV
ncbi:MAG: hypothetical protein QOG55_1163 [Acidobacteriaceae bacterium]|nr:hypothetical protein [Acidobacteriaceae bacterium]